MSWALRDVYPRSATMDGMKRDKAEKGAEMKKYNWYDCQTLHHP